MQLSRQAVRSLGPVLVPAVLAGVLIIIAGVGVAYLLRVVGLAPPGDVLATSPGALSVMSATALEQHTGAVEVAVFHLVRAPQGQRSHRPSHLMRFSRLRPEVLARVRLIPRCADRDDAVSPRGHARCDQTRVWAALPAPTHHSVIVSPV